MTKREELRQKRLRQKRLRRTITIGAIVVVSFLITMVLIYPRLKPVGEIATVEPETRPMADDTAMGDTNAPVKMVVFEDFQCSACRVYTEITEALVVDTYVTTGKVYYVFRQYPFLDSGSTSSESQQSANASMCAAEQNMFWEYHDILFANWNGENMGAFADIRLLAFAESIDLDMETFKSCFDEDRYRNEIRADFQLGVDMGVASTPSVFVNGEKLTPGYVPQFEDLKLAVEAALVEAGE